MRRIILCLVFLLLPTICFGQFHEGPELESVLAFGKGCEMLEAFSTRSSVLEQWKAGLRIDSTNGMSQQIAEYIPILERQIEEDKILASETVADPERLPLQQRIDYDIKRFVDVHGWQRGQPGHCATVSRENSFWRYNALGDGEPTIDKETRYSDSIVRIGRPAIPALIAHLNDTRITRSAYHRMGYFHVLRVQDVAFECIECITHCRFYSKISASDYLSYGPPERIQEIIQQISVWWDRNKDHTPLEGLQDRLATLVKEKSDLYYRLDMLRKIERTDPKAINSVAVLKSWASEANVRSGDLATLADELGQRGDSSLLPEMRKLFRSTEEAADQSKSVGFLLKFGDDADYAAIAASVAKAIQVAGDDYEKLGIAWTVVERAPGQDLQIESPINDPRLIPMLIGLLKFRKESGGTSNYTISIADKAMQSLVFLTNHNTGYKHDAPEPQRFAAIDRWLKWWHDEGSHHTFPKRTP